MNNEKKPKKPLPKPKSGTKRYEKMVATKKSIAAKNRKAGQDFYHDARRAFGNALFRKGIHRYRLSAEEKHGIKTIFNRFYDKLKELREKIKAEGRIVDGYRFKDKEGQIQTWRGFMWEKALALLNELITECPILPIDFPYWDAIAEIYVLESKNVRVTVICNLPSVPFRYTSEIFESNIKGQWKVKPGFGDDADSGIFINELRQFYGRSPYAMFELEEGSAKVNHENGYCECTYTVQTGTRDGSPDEHPEEVRHEFNSLMEEKYGKAEDEDDFTEIKIIGDEQEQEQEKQPKGKKKAEKSAKQAELEAELKIKNVDLKLAQKKREIAELENKTISVKNENLKLEGLNLFNKMYADGKLTKEEWQQEKKKYE